MLTGIAYAMGGSPGGGSGGAGGLMGLLPILLMFVIFYFLLIRPQQKQARKHQDFIKGLKVGDRVTTTGGLHGEVKGLTETTITLEIAEKVRVKVTRSAVSGSSQEAATPEAQKPA
ncbi:MAG: preprotein translocase subunit YajC [Deltaproteobacteria bacterium]|nr:preprotein translocase subunit YajC [Deltaproteobacteria bacterium]